MGTTFFFLFVILRAATAIYVLVDLGAGVCGLLLFLRAADKNV